MVVSGGAGLGSGFCSPMPSESYQYTSPLLSIKQRIRNANHDKTLLANRISLLQKEESKAWRRIQLTKKRASEILSMREENERRVMERLHMAELAVVDQRAVQEKHAELEKTSRQNRLAQQEDMLRQKRDGVVQTRQEKQARREELMAQKAKVIKENQRRRQSIKEKEENLRLKRENERAKVVAETRRAYEERVRQEAEELQSQEKKVKKMEKLELKLIQQLKNTQMLQQQSYQELEMALNDSRVASATANLSQVAEAVGG